MIPITSRPADLPERPGPAIVPPAKDAAAASFETLFMGLVVKAMRAPSLGPGLFESDAGRSFRDMLDDRLMTGTSTQGTGVGKMLAAAYLAGKTRHEQPR